MDDERFGLIVRIIAAVKNIKCQNPLSDTQMAMAAEDWNDVLAPVATADLAAVRTIGLRAGADTADKFYRVWQDMERTRQRALLEAEELENAKAKVKQEADFWANAAKDSLESQTASMQKKRWGKGLLALACGCDDHRGAPITAVLSHDAQHWVCPNRICDYSVPVSETMTAPTRGTRLISNVLEWSVPRLEDIPKKVKTPAEIEQERAVTQLEGWATDCGLDLHSLPAHEYTSFKQFCYWYFERYESGLCRETLDQLWPVWANECAEKRQQAVT
jgi:hypothetical protein